MRWRRVDNPDVIDRRGRRGGGLPLPIGEWFERGYENGDAGACDTFSTEDV